MKIYFYLTIIVLLLHFALGKPVTTDDQEIASFMETMGTEEAFTNSQRESTRYHFASGKMTFESAQSYCKGKKMQLIKIEDKETNQLVYGLAKRHKFGHYWIDGNDKEIEGVFVDSQKKRLIYTNWNSNDPDNYKNKEHCAHVLIDVNGFWNDLPCSDFLNVICEPIESETINYHFATRKMSFESAQSYCKGMQMQLIKIEDKETNELVYDWAKRHQFSHYWIDGNDKETEGVFVNSDKNRLTYTNWHPKQPDNYGNTEHCAHVIIDKNGLWNDFPCSNLLNVVCEPIETTSYHFAKEKMSFESAESYCKGKQMQLVKIEDDETNQFVYDWAKRHRFGHYWINGNDKESEGIFVDSDKKRLTYTNWHPKQPDNYGNGEDCVHVIIDKNGLWNDFPCSNLLNVICEPIETTSYHFATDKMSFESAQSYCEGKQMQLVKIESEEINKLVYDWSKRHHFGHYWIDGNDKDSEGVFVNSNKKKLIYTKWNSEQPDNTENDEDCVHVIADKNGLWNVLSCGDRLNVVCEPKERETTTYHFAKRKMSFEAAGSYCKGKEMQLVRLENAETNKLVYDWAKRHRFGHYWIDGNDKETEGVFVDSDKKRITYTNWNSEQPDNYENAEHCVHVVIDKNGVWNDLPCSNLLNVVCQPIEILDFFNSVANTLRDMSKSILEKIKEYFS